MRLHPGRDEDVADGHAGQRHDGEDEEERLAVGRRPQQETGRGGGEAERDARGHPDPTGEAHRERTDDSEAQAGQPGQCTRDSGAHPEALADLLEDRPR